MTQSPPASRFPALPLPAAGWPLLLVLAVFLLSGSIGHDPWKIEDAAHFGVVWRAHGAGDWLNFRFAYANVVEPPLYYWVASALGGLLGPLIGWPDAVRLASPLFAGATCALLYLAARELFGREAAGAAPLAFAGALGFLVQSHETQPMLAALSGIAATAAGVALGRRLPWHGAVLTGAGLAVIVLAHGVTLLPAMLVAVFAGAMVAPQRRTGLLAALAAIALAGLLAAPWLWALDGASPSVLSVWWASEMAQFSAVAKPGGNAWRYAEVMAWFAWPALPLALWALWTQRHRLGEPAQLLPLVAVVAMAANLALVFPARVVTVLPMLPVLAVLAVPGLLALRRGAASAFDWFGRMTFTLIGGLIWLGWVAMVFGVPPRIARNVAKLAPGFEAGFEPLPVAAAALATLLWLWLLAVRPGPPAASPMRPLAHWFCGMAMLWVLAICLLLPWIEYGKSYRSVAAAIDRKIASPSACLAVRDVGEGQYASLDYFLDRRIQPEAAGRTGCRWLIVQGTSNESAPGRGWIKVWEGNRPGDRSERFRLYRRG